MKDKPKIRQAKHIREGMEVIARKGNDKGRVGTVLSRDETHAVVQGLNVRKKHQKRRSETQPGGIINIEMPIHLANLAAVSEDEKAVRVRTRGSGENKAYVYGPASDEKVLRNVKKSK